MPSERILEQKKKAVDDLAEKFKATKAMVFADFRGLTVEQDTEMRRALREAGVEYKVIKNTLAGFALDKAGLSGLKEYLEGPTSIASSITDPVAPAKIMFEYSSKFEKLELKAGMVEGKMLDVNGVKALAKLPSREQLVAMTLGALNAPIASFVYVLKANLTGLALALKAIAEQKEGK